MPARHHEVPTHLDVEDKVLFGLTVRQFLYLLVGSSTSYALWEQLVSFGDGPRAALAGLCAGVTVAFALLRPAGRPLEEWLMALVVYCATPHRATWRPVEPDPSQWRPASAAWQELVPNPVWAEDEAP